MLRPDPGCAGPAQRIFQSGRHTHERRHPMRERAPALVALLLLVTLVMGTWWAAEFAQRAIPIDPPRRVTHEPDSWARSFVMVRTDSQGVANNRLEGETMKHYPDDDSYEITRAKAIG